MDTHHKVKSVRNKQKPNPSDNTPKPKRTTTAAKKVSPEELVPVPI